MWPLLSLLHYLCQCFMKWSQTGTYLLHMITPEKIVFQKGADLGL